MAGATTTGSGPVRVTAGSTATSSNYTIISGLPVINSFSPATGNAGTTVVINGVNLYIDNGSPNPTVTIGANNTPATFVGYTGNDLSVTVGAGTNTGLINVTTTYGTVTSTTNFTVASGAPTITSFTPASGPVGTVVTITGTNFTGATNVFVGAGVTNSAFTLNSATQITATIPPGATTGPISVVTTGFMATSATNFTVTAATPTITSFTPASGPVGTAVVITGTNFTGASAVSFNNTAAATFTVNSATQITATVAGGTLTGAIRVTAAGTTATSATNFTVTYPPFVASIDILSGTIGSIVTVNGTNLLGATAVSANGINLPVTNNTATTISFQILSSCLSGPIVLNTSGGGVTTDCFTITTAANVLQHIPGQTLTLTSATTAATYQWQVNTGSGFANITNNANYSGATANRLVVTNAPSSWSGYQYRVIAGGVNATPLTLRFVHTSLGGDWNDVDTWHMGQFPDQYGDVVLYPSSPTLNVNVNAACRSLTVTNSRQVQIKTGVNLTIHK